VVLAALGIVGMSIAFPTVYLYSAELFPTVVRNVGVGSSSMCARFGSMVAPYVTSLVSSKHFIILEVQSSYCLLISDLIKGVLSSPLIVVSCS
jgi:MFS family permease